ncbi:hypothetical protein Vretimale_1183 [Volvox reticuliferus]|uniref:Uncharacterized protein n=1 Tax=Volvox reticuliferus TaxID=1737510 RepID=A0A8J4FLH4_9CHLO|nr:hypothetical protein Vretifemale_10304 [Volvox reticuliferus]GIL95094.1 hypothetical protein Vretimale_1183 [Volvox reticuliferus]
MRLSVILACAFVLVVGTAPLYGASDSSVVLPAPSPVSGFGDASAALAAAGLLGVPLRVDYRDRDETFDLNLLSAATGMCSISGGCNACAYRDSNPCEVADRYGADPSLCHLPSFLGGDVTSDTLCGIGATVDVTLSGGGSEPVATLTAFRKRGGSLLLTVTARCGWVLVPFVSTALNQTGGSTSARVIMEGDANYLGSDNYFSGPTLGVDGEVERYSCYTTVVKLRGLSSKCQALNLDLDLKLAMQRLNIIEPNASSSAPVCDVTSSVVEATAHLMMRVPQAYAQSASMRAAAVSEEEAAAAKQKLFSSGVAGTTSYFASVDPRDPQAISWLQSLTSQFPVVSAVPSSEKLSFLIGSVRKENRTSQVPATGQDPLLPEALSLETCSLQSIAAVTEAVVSALASLGIKEKDVSDVICLRSPYTEVAATEIPPCARYTSVLYNVTLDITLGPERSSSTTSSLLNGLNAASKSSSGSGKSSSDTPANPLELADALVGAQLAAPWVCLSTEGQMRMSSQIQLDLQLPKGPGEVKTTAGAVDPTAATPSTTNPGPASGPGTAVPNSGDNGSPAESTGGSKTTFGTVAVVAVAVAVALVALVALVAFFSIRSVRRSKAAAQAAAAQAAAATATAATLAAARGRYTYGTGALTKPPAGKLAPSPSPLSPMKTLYGEPSGLDAETSYASTYDGMGKGASPNGDGGAAMKATPTEGVTTWAENANSLSPAASAAALEPFAAAVEAAAIATAAPVAPAAPGGGSYTIFSGIGGMAPSECSEEEGDGAQLVSNRVPLSPISRAVPPAAPPRVGPVTPPAAAAAGGSQSFGVRSPTSPPSAQPTPLRRHRTLKLPVAISGSSTSNSPLEESKSGRNFLKLARPEASGTDIGTPSGTAAGATVWSNALYDAPVHSCSSGDPTPPASVK